MISLGLHPHLLLLSMGFSLSLHFFVFLLVSGVIKFFQPEPRLISLEVRMVTAPPQVSPFQPISPPKIPQESAPINAHKTPPPSSPSPSAIKKRSQSLSLKKHSPPRTSRNSHNRNPKESLQEIRELLKRYPASPLTSSEAESGEPTYDLPPGVEGRLYFQEVIAKIQGVWKVPPGTRGANAEIEIVLDQNGKLRELKLLRGSGDPLFDGSAQSAVLQAHFPPPPSGWRTPLRLKLILVPPEGP